MSCGMSNSIYGNYRIDELFFPVPATQWEEQPIAAGLNGLSINSSYKLHHWNWSNLDAELAKTVFQRFDALQSAGSQPSVIETDPYDAGLSDEKYGTKVYSDVIIRALSPRSRSLPFYDNISITFEVLVS